MPTFNWVDILFIATVILLAFNGFRNGAVVSLINLLTIPIGFAVAYVFGPPFTRFLAQNGLSGTPLISYIVLFFTTVLVIHIIAAIVRVVLLAVLGSFLGGIQDTITKTTHIIPGVGINVPQFKQWHDFYNQAVTNSLFARVNSFIIKTLPALKTIVPGPTH